MKVSLFVALATVTPFGFFILAAIMSYRYARGQPIGPEMFGLKHADWLSQVRDWVAHLGIVQRLRTAA